MSRAVIAFADSFRDHEGALPIVAAVEHDEDAAGIGMAESLGAIAGEPRSRIHSTSIGAPRSSTSKPARSRTVEWRPSVPTTRSARISYARRVALRRDADDPARRLRRARSLASAS